MISKTMLLDEKDETELLISKIKKLPREEKIRIFYMLKGMEIADAEKDFKAQADPELQKTS